MTDAGQRSLHQAAVDQFQRAADLIDLDDAYREILSHPKNEIIVNFPVRMNDGQMVVTAMPRSASSYPSASDSAVAAAFDVA